MGFARRAASEGAGKPVAGWAAPDGGLGVFIDKETTLFLVGRRRGRDVIYEVPGADYPGVLVSDCLSIYDDATGVQQKCNSHPYKAIVYRLLILA